MPGNPQAYYKWNKASPYVVLATQIASFIFVIFALLGDAPSSDFESKVLIFVKAFLAAAIGTGGWIFFFQQLPRCTSPQEKKKLWFGLVLYLFLVLSISSTLGGIGAVGNQARHYLIMKTIENAEAAYTHLIKQRWQLETILPPLISARSVFESAAKRERTGGLLSGRSGPGKIVAAVQGLEDGYGRVEEALKAEIKQTERLHTKGSRLLDELRLIANDRSQTTNEKYERLAPLYSTLKGLFLDLQKDAVSPIIAEVERIDRLYLLKSDPETEAVLAALKQPMAETKAMILDAAEKIRSLPIQTPSFRIVGSFEAVISTSYLYYAVIYSLSVDFIINFAVLLILNFLASGIRQSSGIPKPPQNSSGHSNSLFRMPERVPMAAKPKPQENHLPAAKPRNSNGSATSADQPMGF